MNVSLLSRRKVLAGGVLAGLPGWAAAVQRGRVLPVRFAANQASISVSFNGRPAFPFLVDSGAVHVGMSAPELSALGLRHEGIGLATGAAGDIASQIYRAARMRVGNEVTLKDIEVRSLNLGPVIDMDQPAGLLPLSLLAPCLLDIVGGVLTLFDRKAPAPAGLTTFPANDELVLSQKGRRLRYTDPRPYAAVTLFGKTLRCMLDTGYSGALILTSKYVRDSGLTKAFGEGASRSLAGSTGAVSASMMPVDALGFAGRTFKSQWIELNDPAADIPGDVDYQGVVGMELLRRFDLWVPGQSGGIGLRPNSWIDDVERYDRSGLEFALPASGGPGVVITKVAPASPADKAGLKAKDLLLGYNGLSGLDALRWVLAGPPGSKVALSRMRDGAEQSTILVLQEPP